MTKLRVLLVDDEEEFLEVLSLRLEARGIEVETATSGEQALAIAERKAFDVAVVDLTMPDMDGIETLQRLKLFDPILQVILLTGHSSTVRGRVVDELGAADLVSKPANFERLFAKIVEAGRMKRQLANDRGK